MNELHTLLNVGPKQIACFFLEGVLTKAIVKHTPES